MIWEESFNSSHWLISFDVIFTSKDKNPITLKWKIDFWFHEKNSRSRLLPVILWDCLDIRNYPCILVTFEIRKSPLATIFDVFWHEIVVIRSMTRKWTLNENNFHRKKFQIVFLNTLTTSRVLQWNLWCFWIPETLKMKTIAYISFLLLAISQSD